MRIICIIYYKCKKKITCKKLLNKIILRKYPTTYLISTAKELDPINNSTITNISAIEFKI